MSQKTDQQINDRLDKCRHKLAAAKARNDRLFVNLKKKSKS